MTSHEVQEHKPIPDCTFEGLNTKYPILAGKSASILHKEKKKKKRNIHLLLNFEVHFKLSI